MNEPQILISSQTARQILLAAEQNGLTVENYLKKIAVENNGKENHRRLRKATINFDFSKTQEWLQNHRHEYTGKWVVLDGDVLLGAGGNPLPLVEKARADGVKTPFVKFIGDDSEPFTGGWL